MSEQQEEKLLIQRLTEISRAFSPAAPVGTRELFAGRQRELFRVIDVIGQVGQHTVIYGDRGVGKTSLATISASDVDFPSVHYTCHSGDTFGTIWAEALQDLTVAVRVNGVGFVGGDSLKSHSLLDLVDPGAKSVEPQTVRRALKIVDQLEPTIIIDEFDQVEDEQTKTMMADLIKILSDQRIRATIILVGVASTIGELVREHESIERSLTQVKMPKMTIAELREIVTKGMAACEVPVSDEFVDRVAWMSGGLPHYTHLISQHAARMAVEHGDGTVDLSDLRGAIEQAQHDVKSSVVTTYANATRQTSKPTHYDYVLVACALADKDDLGRFGTPQVRSALTAIEHPLEIPAFTPHLTDFSGDGPRGGVLYREGKPMGHQTYMFRNPLFPPYVLMRAYAKGLVDEGLAAPPAGATTTV